MSSVIFLSFVKAIIAVRRLTYANRRGMALYGHFLIITGTIENMLFSLSFSHANICPIPHF